LVHTVVFDKPCISSAYMFLRAQLEVSTVYQ